MNWLVLTTLGCTSRLSIRDLYRRFSDISPNKKPIRVIIYRAGAAGAQLASFLKGDKKGILFWHLLMITLILEETIYSIPIYSLEYFTKIKGSIDQVLLALAKYFIKEKKDIYLILLKSLI